MCFSHTPYNGTVVQVITQSVGPLDIEDKNLFGPENSKEFKCVLIIYLN